MFRVQRVKHGAVAPGMWVKGGQHAAPTGHAYGVLAESVGEGDGLFAGELVQSRSSGGGVAAVSRGVTSPLICDDED